MNSTMKRIIVLVTAFNTITGTSSKMIAKEAARARAALLTNAFEIVRLSEPLADR